ncbi:MAG: hypothetical protein HY537_02360 [Deltaproteobacteria bacterium]|nr:hypothetical protein [Deltaproteobacteria bacterium]
MADRLSKSVQASNLQVPAEHEAGVELKLSFVLNKNDLVLTESDGIKQDSSGNLNSIISKPYKKFIHHVPSPSLADFFYSDSKSQRFEAVTKIAENIDGTAQLRLSLTLITRKGICLLATVLDSVTVFHSKNPDIIPPLVRQIRYEKIAYRPGETVSVLFELSEPLAEAQSSHIEFRNREIPIGKPSSAIPQYGPMHDLRDKGNNFYEFSFDISKETLPGKYFPAYFNRRDKVGNFESEIGTEDKLEKQVVERSPLVVIP